MRNQAFKGLLTHSGGTTRIELKAYEPEATVTEFMKTHKMSYSVATDTKGWLKNQLGVSGIPHVLVISPDHIVRYQGFPSSDQDPLTEATLSKIIEASQ